MQFKIGENQECYEQLFYASCSIRLSIRFARSLHKRNKSDDNFYKESREVSHIDLLYIG